MIFDRIIEDSLGFIRRTLWSQAVEHDACQSPFKSMHTFEGDHGVISLLEGRDTPRAVRTWMYSPKHRELNSARMVANARSMDLHIYCDFLGPLPNVTTPRAQEERDAIAAKRQRNETVPSHRVQIFKASHFLNTDGFYDYDLVFWQDRSFYIEGVSNINKIAQSMMDKLARRCLTLGKPLQFKAEDWEETLDKIWNEAKLEVIAKLAEKR